MRINEHRAGLTVGVFIGVVHIVWSCFVAFGWAKPVLDFIFMIHMIKPSYSMQAFNLGTAIELIVVVVIIGYIIGRAFATIWNKLHHKG